MSIDQLSKIINAALQLGFFMLMCTGLLIASIMLYIGKVDGGQWVTLCGILFGSDRLGHALGQRVSND